LREDLEKRIFDEAAFIIDTGATVRACAARYGVSKTTAHKDMTFRLPHMDRRLYLLVKSVLEKNKAERHLRGGMATREKYRRQHTV